MKVTEKHYGELDEGRKVRMWTIETEAESRSGGSSPGAGAGLSSISLIEYGATLVSALHRGDEICLGFGSLEKYRSQAVFMGATCGRFSNRIRNGRFTLDGKEYQISTNDGHHALHGGEDNYSRRLWESRVLEDPSGRGRWAGIEFFLLSPDGDEGFPGRLEARVSYVLSADGDLLMHYRAESDAPTPVNLTNHAYWNLGGQQAGSILDHSVQIFADRLVDVDAQAIPTGVLSDPGCGSGHYDLSSPVDMASRLAPRVIGGTIEMEPALPRGYDHCYALNPQGEYSPAMPVLDRLPESSSAMLEHLAAELVLNAAARVQREGEGHSGRSMEIYTSYPGIQFYSGNFLNEKDARDGLDYPRQSAFCLETQYFPDSPNNPHFPDCILRPGQRYEHASLHRFV